MKNFMQVAMWLFLGVFLCSIPVVAQNPAPGSNLTDKIVNPDFDAGNGDGWTIEGTTPTWIQKEAEVWNRTFDMYQTVELPAGAYRLTVDGFYQGVDDAGASHAAGTEEINAVLYARTGTEYKETPLFSVFSVKGFQGSTQMKNGYVAGVISAREAFDAGHYNNNTVHNIVVEEGQSLTIGIKTLKLVTYHWIIWDSFKLTYLGEPGIGVYYVEINELEQDLNIYHDDGVVSSGSYKEITDALDFKAQFESSTDVDELQSVIDSMTHVLGRAKTAALAMSQLGTQIGVVNGFLDLHYPGESELVAVRNACIALMQYGATTPDGEYVYAEDLVQAVNDLKSALRTYRFTQPVASEGIDFTWAMQAPNFTKEGGDPSNSADGSSLGWAYSNIPAAGSQYRLNFVNGKNCWNNWANNFTSMNVFQEMEGFPAGFYSFSCYQTNEGPAITDQHAYITAVGGTSDSPVATYSFAFDDDPNKGTFTENSKWEGPLATGRVLVGSDGKLRVGFASTGGDGSSGWFCITDCQLTYYGMAEGAYDEAMKAKIAEAKALENLEILPGDLRILKEGIKVAEGVDTSDNEAAQAGLEALSEVIDRANNVAKAWKTFETGVYATAAEMAEDSEGLYSETVHELMYDVVLNAGTMLAADTASAAVLPALTAQFNECMAFVTRTVQKAETVIENDLYSEEARTELSEVLAEQLDKLKTDLSKLPQVEANLIYVIKMTTLTQDVAPGEGMDVTIWIQNPGLDETVYDNGWTNRGFVRNTVLLTKDDGYAGVSCAESWVAGGGRLGNKTFSQTMSVPNGTYVLSVVATVCQQGTLTIYEEDGETIKETFTLTTPVTGAWLFANEDSVEMATPMIGEAAPYENQTVDNEPHSEGFTLENIVVKDNTLTFGVKTRSATANWIAFDSFELTCLEYAVAIEEINADANTLFAYAEDGYIKVVGADQFTVTTIEGKAVSSPSLKLTPGIYIVRAGTQVVKVMVK